MGKSRTSKTKNTILWLFAIPLAVVVAIILYSVMFLFTTLNTDSTRDITLTEKSIGPALQVMADSGYIESPVLFTMIARTYSVISGRRFTPGEYRITPSMTHARLLRMLYSGNQSYTVNVSIPEGLSLKKIASIVKKKVGIDSVEFIKLANDDSLMQSLGIKAQSLEGYCMPDTYNFFWKQKSIDIIKKMVAVHRVFWDDECEKLLTSQKLNKHQVLTLASIIEAEASVKEERSIISGVYHNRLKRGIKLEADPTVQYAIGKQKRLVFSDLRVDNKFNTYKYVGLPPGPINCPGRASILAALQPANHNYIFFVAVGDGSGKHVFSVTAQQHGKAVANYRKNRKND